jgi:hypothetical protein
MPPRRLARGLLGSSAATCGVTPDVLSQAVCRLAEQVTEAQVNQAARVGQGERNPAGWPARNGKLMGRLTQTDHPRLRRLLIGQPPFWTQTLGVHDTSPVRSV